MMKNLEAYINTLTDFSAQSLAILQECMVPLTFKVTANLTIIKMEKTLTSHFILKNEFATNLHSLRTDTASEYILQACESLKVVKPDKEKTFSSI